MFTGIITHLGTIQSVHTITAGKRFWIVADDINNKDLQLGASVAVDGCCLTIAEIEGSSFALDLSAETLKLTTLDDKKTGATVNLEWAATPTTALGGHIVSGHIDGKAKVTAFEQQGASRLLKVAMPDDYIKYMPKKGSVTLNGVSLTINDNKNNTLEITLIPHTLENTNLKDLQLGDDVNFEVDLLARYLEQLGAVNHA